MYGLVYRWIFNMYRAVCMGLLLFACTKNARHLIHYWRIMRGIWLSDELWPQNWVMQWRNGTSTPYFLTSTIIIYGKGLWLLLILLIIITAAPAAAAVPATAPAATTTYYYYHYLVYYCCLAYNNNYYYLNNYYHNDYCYCLMTPISISLSLHTCSEQNI